MSRRAQPYRKMPGRQPSPVLAAMRRGRSALRANPMDVRRQLERRRAEFARRMSARRSTLARRNG